MGSSPLFQQIILTSDSARGSALLPPGPDIALSILFLPNKDLVNAHRCGDYKHDPVSSFRSDEDTCWDATKSVTEVTFKYCCTYCLLFVYYTHTFQKLGHYKFLSFDKLQSQ